MRFSYLLLVVSLIFTTTLQAQTEIRWARGTADGNFVGNYTDAMNWDGGIVPMGTGIRARCDRADTMMTMNTTIDVQEIFFGVDESNQNFFIEAPAVVSTESNYFAAFNGGSNTTMTGGELNVTGNFLLGFFDDPSFDDRDVNFVVEGGTVNISGATILGDQFDNMGGFVFDRNILLEINGGEFNSGGNVVFAPNGDLAAFLAGTDNSMEVRVNGAGVLRYVGSDFVDQVNQNIVDGLMGTDDPNGLSVEFDGADTVVMVASSKEVLLGDVNLDGVVDLLDVSPFVDLITDGLFQAEGDVNQDGVVDLLDVAPFVEILTGG